MQPAPEKVALDSHESFRVTAADAGRFSAPWHQHPELELTLIRSSSGTRFVGDSVRPFRPGDLVLLGGNLPHCWLNAEDAGPGRARAVVVQFAPEFLGAAFVDSPEAIELRGLFRRAARGLQFGRDTHLGLQTRLERLPERHGMERVIGLLSILHELSRAPDAVPLASAAYRPPLATRGLSRMERIHGLVMERFSGPIRLEDAAGAVQLTPSSFCRFFRRAFGKTFVQYLNEVRIGQACRLLTQQEVSVTEACFASGFNNLSHFNRQFRRVTGHTPRSYRACYAGAASEASSVTPGVLDPAAYGRQ